MSNFKNFIYSFYTHIWLQCSTDYTHTEQTQQNIKKNNNNFKLIILKTNWILNQMKSRQHIKNHLRIKTVKLDIFEEDFLETENFFCCQNKYYRVYICIIRLQVPKVKETLFFWLGLNTIAASNFHNGLCHFWKLDTKVTSQKPTLLLCESNR